MNTVIASPEDDKEFFRMLSNPFTFDWVSTKGGERRIIGQGIEWPDGRIELHYPNLATLMEFEPPDVQIDWHSSVHDETVNDSQPR